MAAKLGTFLATCLVLCACLAGIRRLYVAVSAVPLERLSPAAPAARPVKPIVLPAEPVSPDFGYSDEAREPEERPETELQAAAKEAADRAAAASALKAKAEPAQAEKAPPPEKKAKAKKAPRPPEARQSVRELLEQARQRAGRLQRVGFRQDETVMTGGAGVGAGASEGTAEHHGAAQPGAGAQAGPAQSAASSSPPGAPQRAMRAVSIGGNNLPATGAVQRADQTPAVMSDNPGQFEPPDSTQ